MAAIRRGVVLAVATFIVAALVACAAQQPAPPAPAQPAAPAAKAAQPAARAAEPVTIRLGSNPHVESFTDALLIKKVLEAAYPYINVEVIPQLSGLAIVNGLVGGQLDAGCILGDPPAVNGVANKSPFKIVTSYGWGQTHHAFMVPVNSPIKTVAELKGKTVAIWLGTSLHEFAGAVLKEKAGLSLSDLNVVNMSEPDATVALRAGKVDAAPLSSSSLQKLAAEGVARSLQDGSGTSWANTFAIVLHDRFIKEHPVESRRFVEAVRIEQEFQHEHAVLAAELYGNHPEVKLGFEPALKAVTSFPRFPRITDPATVGVWQRVADFLLEQKTLKEKLDIAQSGYVVTSFYEEAEKRLGKFPYERGQQMKVDMSEKGKSTDEALKPYIERLKKADPQ